MLVLLGIAVAAFAGVAVHEWDYKNAHPYAYGPAEVIAVAGGAGALLGLTVGWILIALHRDGEHELERRRSEHKRAYDAIRSLVDSGELTEEDYGEWFWLSGEGDVTVRTRVFLLERGMAGPQ